MSDHQTLHVDIVANAASYRAAMKDSARETREFGRDADKASKDAKRLSDELNSMSGRMGLLVKGMLAVSPAITPLSTAAVAGLSALGNQVAFAAAGAGAMTLAFMGMGDALDALNAYALEPTAANFEKVQQQLDQLAPAAADFAVQLQGALHELKGIQEATVAGFFPGAGRGLDSLLEAVPMLERLAYELGHVTGDLTAELGAGLSSDRAQQFIEFLQGEARPAMTAAYDAATHLAGGLAELWMAFDPVNDDIAGGLVSAAARFDSWASSLRGTDDFEEFLRYVEETGPQVVETAGAIANAVLQIGEAAAPLGGPVLQGIELFADAVATIADSPIGPPIMTAVTAMSALSLATKAFGAAAGLSFAQAGMSVGAYVTTLRGANGAMAQMGAVRAGVKGAGVVGAATAASAIGMQYTALGAVAGSVIPGIGTAAGAATGAVLDMATALGRADKAAKDFDDALASGDVSQIQQALDAKKEAIEDLETGHWGLKDAYDALAKGSPYRQQMYREEASAEKALADATEEAARQEGYASEETRKRVESLYALHDAVLAELNAELGWQQAMLDATKTVNENGRVVDQNGNALAGHAQAALDSKREVYGLIAAWNEQVRTGDATKGQLNQTRGAVRRMAADMGLGKEKTKELIDALDRIPAKKKTKVEVATQEAIASLGAFTRLYNSIQSKSVTITTKYAGYGSDVDDLLLGPIGPKKPRANGGIEIGGVTAFASGGYGVDGTYYDRSPRIVRGGTNILWGEQETGFEAYISGKPSQRARNVEILKQTASRFGLHVTPKGVAQQMHRLPRDQVTRRIASYGPHERFGSQPVADSGPVKVTVDGGGMPDTITLQIGKHQFEAVVKGVADKSVAYAGNLAGRSGSSTERMRW